MTDLTTIQMEIKYIKEKLENMPTRDEMKLANKDLVEEVLSACDGRYAPKWIESWIKAIVITVTGWIIYYVLDKA
jgi:hypothetical protein